MLTGPRPLTSFIWQPDALSLNLSAIAVGGVLTLRIQRARQNRISRAARSPRTAAQGPG